jgi:hypothetical protein
MKAYFASMESLAYDILRILAATLYLEENFFNDFIDTPIATLRLLHYPPQPPTASPDERGKITTHQWPERRVIYSKRCSKCRLLLSRLLLSHLLLTHLLLSLTYLSLSRLLLSRLLLSHLLLTHLLLFDLPLTLSPTPYSSHPPLSLYPRAIMQSASPSRREEARSQMSQMSA